MSEQSKCPFTGAGTPPKFPTGKGTTNKDWWPNSLNLKILSQHSSLVDPMGDKFNYSKVILFAISRFIFCCCSNPISKLGNIETVLI